MLKEKIRELADNSGIDALAFADASEFIGYDLNNSLRKDPRKSLPDARSIIVAGIYIGGMALPVWNDPMYGRTSRLYLSGFFLDIVKPLENIKSFLEERGYDSLICDGSKKYGSILPLKLAAVRAGIGWQGKNSLLITKKYGSFLALGGIITNADLKKDSNTHPDLCGKCNKCREACPMSALAQAYALAKKECLSCQLQTESLSEKARLISGNRIADCEICQDVCPWNRKHLENPLLTPLTLSFKEKMNGYSKHYYLPDLASMSAKEYKKESDGLRTDIRYKVIHRNVLIALVHARQS